MSMRPRPKSKQPDLWIATSDLARVGCHVYAELRIVVITRSAGLCGVTGPGCVNGGSGESVNSA